MNAETAIAESDLLNELDGLVDRNVGVAGFNDLLKRFIRDKMAERARWAEMTVAVHRMLGGASPEIYRQAAAVEAVILALDIADDLQDRDNVEKSWMQCKPEYALNAVLALMAGTFGEIAAWQSESTGKTAPDASEIGRIIMRSVNGQYKDLAQSVETEEDYIAMVREKSGSLIRLAFYTGYASVPVDPTVAESLNAIADHVGIIAQLENDLKDLLRFDLKNDLLNKKRTLPILFLLSDPDENFPLIRQYYEGSVSRGQFLQQKQACVDYIQNSGCVEYTRVIQTLFADKANELLESIPARSPWKETFRRLALLDG